MNCYNQEMSIFGSWISSRFCSETVQCSVVKHYNGGKKQGGRGSLLTGNEQKANFPAAGLFPGREQEIRV